jgi:glucosylceramidase
MFAKNNSAIDGVAVHWYSDRDDHSALTSVHNQFPDKIILASEASNADRSYQHMPLLGNWDYAQRYAHDVIQNLRNWAVGWVWIKIFDIKPGVGYMLTFSKIFSLKNAYF